MFKKGDLFFLNDRGKILFDQIGGENGLIMSDAYLLFSKSHPSDYDPTEYYGYDILIKGILFKEVPEKFLLRVVRNEKDIV